MKNETKMKIRVLAFDFPVFLILCIPVTICWGLAMVLGAFLEHVEGLIIFGQSVDKWNAEHPKDPSPNEWF